MNGFDASKAIGEVNLFDLKNKLLRLINACQSEIDIGETDKTNKILLDYTQVGDDKQIKDKSGTVDENPEA